MCRTLISARILEQVLLVIRLCGEPLARGLDLCDDLVSRIVKVLRLDSSGHGTRGCGLCVRVCEDGGAVLRANVVTLAVLGCGVVCAVEEFCAVNSRLSGQ
jgi:hypothetical protein